MGNIGALVSQCAPVVRLFPYAAENSPVYDPCSATWFLQKVGVTSGSNPICPASDVENQLPTYPSGACLFITDTNIASCTPDPDASSPVRAGNLPAAVAYVHIKPVGPYFDLQYWFFYAVRGRSTFRLQMLENSRVQADLAYDLLAPPPPQPYQGAGEHQGDWKYVTVRIDQRGDIQAVFLNQHSSGFWCLPNPTGKPNQCQFVLENGHPVVYSSRNTHSCFPMPARSDQMNTLHTYAIAGFGFEVSLLEWTADGGEVWDCSQPGCTFVVCDESVSPPPPRPAWLGFPGYWGPPIDESISPQTFAPIVDAIIGQIPILKDFSGDVESWIADLAQSNVQTPQTGAQTPPVQNWAWSGPTGWQANWVAVGPSGFKGNPGMPLTVLHQDAPAASWVFLSDNDGGVYTICGTQETGWPASWTRIEGTFRGNTPYMPVTAMWRDAAQTTIDIFIADNDGGVYTADATGGNWGASAFTRIGGSFETVPGALVTAVWHDASHTTMDIFTADNRGHIYTANGVPGGAWGGFSNPWPGFSGNPTGMPVTALWRNGVAGTVLDLFLADNRGHIYTASGLPQQGSGWTWGPWSPIDYEGFAPNPGALVTAAWRPTGSTIDLFTSDNKGHVYTINGVLNASGWTWAPRFLRVDPTFTGDASTMPVTAQWCTPTSLSLFVTDARGTAQNLVFNPGDWTPGPQRFSPIVRAFVGSGGAPIAATWHDAGHTIFDLFIADNGGRVFTIAGCPFA